MAVEILIQAMEKGPWKKGYPIVAKDTPCEWGNLEVPPYDVILRVTDASKAQVDNYLSQWYNKLIHEIVAENEQGYRIRVSLPAKISQLFPTKAMRQEIKGYLTDKWNIEIFSSNNDEVVFDIPKPVDLQELKDDLLDKFEEAVDVRKYHFTVEDVDTALANGGVIEMTKAQVLNRIVNRED